MGKLYAWTREGSRPRGSSSSDRSQKNRVGILDGVFVPHLPTATRRLDPNLTTVSLRQTTTRWTSPCITCLLNLVTLARRLPRKLRSLATSPRRLPRTSVEVLVPLPLLCSWKTLLVTVLQLLPLPVPPTSLARSLLSSVRTFLVSDGLDLWTVPITPLRSRRRNLLPLARTRPKVSTATLPS